VRVSRRERRENADEERPPGPGSTLVKVDSRSFCAGGDVITSIGGVEVENVAEMQNALERFAPGATVKVGFVHVDGVPALRRVKLAAQPAERQELASGC
jgi:S1-C subfamily serine protease